VSNRLDQEREARLQPLRISTAKQELQKRNLLITYEDETRIEFVFKGETIKFYPYSGWHSGKNIKDGRGLMKLLKQLK
jgi:hypothetical protein